MNIEKGKNYEELSRTLATKDSLIVQALVIREQLKQSLNKDKEASFDLFKRYVELMFQANYLAGLNEYLIKPSLSKIQLREIIDLENKFAKHDFFFLIDSSYPMYSWTKATNEILLKLLNDNSNEPKHAVSISYLAGESTIIGSKNYKELTSSIILEDIPKPGTYDSANLWLSSYFTEQSWQGLRKTVILVLRDTSLTPEHLESLPSKEQLQNCIASSIKIHVLLCNEIPKEKMQTLQLIAEKTGGLFFKPITINELQILIKDIFNAEMLDKESKPDFTEKLLNQEVSKQWQ
jgi:hypothetical protein